MATSSPALSPRLASNPLVVPVRPAGRGAHPGAGRDRADAGAQGDDRQSIVT